MSSTRRDSFRPLQHFAISTILVAAATLYGVVGPTAAVAATSNDYADPDAWLCLPGREDACSVDLTATVIQADGSTATETHATNAEAPIDCFYVYPTVSNDPSPNSDMQAGAEEWAVIRAQFARFGSVCRTYAPLYRQVTLTALRSLIAGTPMPVDRMLAYQDVVDAWRHYLQHHNEGRGVVLIGHSQGAGILSTLLRQDISNNPVADQIVSALIIGNNFAVPVDGSPSAFPLCEAAEQTGCVVSFVAFRDELPPPDHSRFGRVEEAAMEAACVNPAALRGQPTLDAYLAAGSTGIAAGSEGAAPDWLRSGVEIGTPFVKVPGLLEAECRRDRGFHFLSVRTLGDPAGPRTDRIGGDVVGPTGEVAADWGLHLIDMHLVMGDLLALVERQGGSWLRR